MEFWYYEDAGRQVGPIEKAELEVLVISGRITAETLVWREGMKDWQPYGKLSLGMAPAFGIAPGVACCECLREFPEDEVIRYKDSWVCAACKPIFFQKLKEGLPLPGVMEYGGFWIRFCAKLIDGVILWLVEMGLAIGAGLGISAFLEPFGGSDFESFLMLIVYPILFGVSIAYTVWFLGRYGATPGKMALGLKVVTSTGERLTYGKALGRFFAELLSGITCYIGYIMVAFDIEKRGLHDRICDTRVIRK